MKVDLLRRQILGLGAATVLLVSTLGADEPTQTFDAGGLVFNAPASWKKVPPSNSMRKGEFKIAPAKGDEVAGELAITAFPGSAGGVEQNITRWEKTFKDKDGNQAKAETKKLKGQNVNVTRVEISGSYTPANFGGPKQPEQPNAKLLGAIVITDEASFYLKLVGPEKTITGAAADFDKLIASMKAAK